MRDSLSVPVSDAHKKCSIEPVKMYAFDHANSVVRVGQLSTEAIISSGGPLELARAHREVAKRSEKARYDSRESGSKCDPTAKRRAQNRKSSKSASEGRKAQIRALEQMNTTVQIQAFSLISVRYQLEREIFFAERQLQRFRNFRLRLSDVV